METVVPSAFSSEESAPPDGAVCDAEDALLAVCLPRSIIPITPIITNITASSPSSAIRMTNASLRFRLLTASDFFPIFRPSFPGEIPISIDSYSHSVKRLEFRAILPADPAGGIRLTL